MGSSPAPLQKQNKIVPKLTLTSIIENPYTSIDISTVFLMFRVYSIMVPFFKEHSLPFLKDNNVSILAVVFYLFVKKNHIQHELQPSLP